MANHLTAWLLVLVGLVFGLPAIGVNIPTQWQWGIGGLAFLIIGIGKLVRLNK